MSDAPRSHVHMLMVAAARLTETGGNPVLIADLRKAAEAAAKIRAEGRGDKQEREHEERRIGRQRTMLAMVPDTRAKDALMHAMAQRAYDLMWEGRCTECDAIAEFLPSKLVEEVFSAWESDQDGDGARSKYYGGAP